KLVAAEQRLATARNPRGDEGQQQGVSNVHEEETRWGTPEEDLGNPAHARAEIQRRNRHLFPPRVCARQDAKITHLELRSLLCRRAVRNWASVILGVLAPLATPSGMRVHVTEQAVVDSGEIGHHRV